MRVRLRGGVVGYQMRLNYAQEEWIVPLLPTPCCELLVPNHHVKGALSMHGMIIELHADGASVLRTRSVRRWADCVAV